MPLEDYEKLNCILKEEYQRLKNIENQLKEHWTACKNSHTKTVCRECIIEKQKDRAKKHYTEKKMGDRLN